MNPFDVGKSVKSEKLSDHLLLESKEHFLQPHSDADHAGAAAMNSVTEEEICSSNDLPLTNDEKHFHGIDSKKTSHHPLSSSIDQEIKAIFGAVEGIKVFESFSTVSDSVSNITSSSGERPPQDHCMLKGCNKSIPVGSLFCIDHCRGEMRCEFLGCVQKASDKSGLCSAHGARKQCSFQGCQRGARSSSDLCRRHGLGKRCKVEKCFKASEGKSGLCMYHGGGRRCTFAGCTKGAQGTSGFCIAHGGGRKCTVSGCLKSAHGRTDFCVSHGGGKQCSFSGCLKSACGRTDFCIVHGGGKRCTVSGCTKSARGLTEFCVRHGGGRRCTFDGFGKSAHSNTQFCKSHGTGKRCTWGSGEQKCDKFAWGKSEFCVAHCNMVRDKKIRKQMANCSAISQAESLVLDGKSVVSEDGHSSVTDEINEYPPALLYSVLFPKEHEFEKETLIQLWIAGSLFEKEPLECIASRYFELFVFLGYIQLSRSDLLTG